MESLVLTIDEKHSGKRLDAVLADILPREFPEVFGGISRSQLQKLIAAGGVALDDELVSKSRSLKGGETVEIDLAVWEELRVDRSSIRFTEDELTFDFPILLEDEWLLIGAKPAGVAVHPAPGMREPTLIDYLRAKHFRLADTEDSLKPGIVHRLDRGTSGLLIVAKDTPTHFALQQMFRRREVGKFYLALTLGAEISGQGEIRSFLDRNPKHRQLFRTADEGRLAVSFYRVLESSRLLKLLLVRIITGRTHQIRVQLQSRGQFIVGDLEYSRGPNTELMHFLRGEPDKSYQRGWSEALPNEEGRRALLSAMESCPGVFLHAWHLRFRHPHTGAEVALFAEPPRYFTDALAVMNWRLPHTDPMELIDAG